MLAWHVALGHSREVTVRAGVGEMLNEQTREGHMLGARSHSRSCHYNQGPAWPGGQQGEPWEEDPGRESPAEAHRVREQARGHSPWCPGREAVAAQSPQPVWTWDTVACHLLGRLCCSVLAPQETKQSSLHLLPRKQKVGRLRPTEPLGQGDSQTERVTGGLRSAGLSHMGDVATVDSIGSEGMGEQRLYHIFSIGPHPAPSATGQKQ